MACPKPQASGGLSLLPPLCPHPARFFISSTGFQLGTTPDVAAPEGSHGLHSQSGLVLAPPFQAKHLGGLGCPGSAFQVCPSVQHPGVWTAPPPPAVWLLFLCRDPGHPQPGLPAGLPAGVAGSWLTLLVCVLARCFIATPPAG